MLKSKLATAAAALALSFGAIGSAQAVVIVAGDFKFTIDNYDSGTTGYAAGGAQTGTAVGTKLTADKLVYLKASATLTTPVVVKVEYYIPQQGMSF